MKNTLEHTKTRKLYHLFLSANTIRVTSIPSVSSLKKKKSVLAQWTGLSQQTKNTYIYIYIYTYIQHPNTHKAFPPHPHAGAIHRGAGGGMGEGIPYGDIPILDIGYWISILSIS